MSTSAAIAREDSATKESDNFSTDPEVSSIDHPTEKQLDKIYRRLDYRIIPALWCLYFMTSFGSSAYGTTLTMNYEVNHTMPATLGLTSHDLSTASALYYVAYIIFDLPMNLIMTKVSPQIWLSRIAIGVGLCYICYLALKNAAGLEAIRFITGFAVSGDWPGMTYYISLWYPEQRTARRIGYYFSAAQISTAVAGLVSAGFQKIDGNRGYYGWQWMYIVYGSFMMAVGIALIWWLPDRPTHLAGLPQHHILPESLQKYFTPRQPLTERERCMHEVDMKKRYKQVNWGWKDVLLVLKDARTWALIMMYFGVVGTGYGLAVFATSLIKINNPSLSGIDISLLYAPIWLFDFAAILLITPLADKYHTKRPYIFCAAVLIIITGLLVTSFAPGKWTRWGGLLICGFGLGPTVPTCMTLAAEIMTKVYGDVGCAVASAVVSGFGNLGTVVGVYALYSGWPADKARHYRNSNMILVMMLGVSIIACIILTILRKHMSEDKYIGHTMTFTDPTETTETVEAKVEDKVEDAETSQTQEITQSSPVAHTAQSTTQVAN